MSIHESDQISSTGVRVELRRKSVTNRAQLVLKLYGLNLMLHRLMSSKSFQFMTHGLKQNTI
ncbi:hypothetical protein D1BOALGB6SA_654 [Olavius sp. associated proteobacterium Delta 1]|nr:hypothetical protein D1BOALGB6SA_654 [Olavius sp. associated proteobacterium Delta 1]